MSVAGTSILDELNTVYGTDKYFDNQKRVTGKGDWQLVSAEENLRRAIIRRIITAPGGYKWKPTYGVGLGIYVKKPINQAVIEELTSRIRSQVAQDRRVDKVIEVTVEKALFGDQPGLRVTVVVQALGRTLRPISINQKRTA